VYHRTITQNGKIKAVAVERHQLRCQLGNLIDAEATQRFAKELVALQPDVILSHNTPATAALLQQTRTIPIIFATVGDPVGSGFVASFPRPGGIDGMLREYAVLEEDGVVKLPTHLSFEEGATLPCAGVTAWNALVEHAHLLPGQAVLIQGTGGVSIFALQFARLMGAQVIATSSSNQKLARAKQLGATDGVNYKTNPDWEKAVAELTGGGVDHVVEVGGPGTLARSLRAIRIGGKITLIGVLSGAAEINPMLIFSRRANVQGISVGSRQMFEAMNRAIAVSGLKPIIDKAFSFNDVPAAYRYLQSAQHFGKIVIRLG
jgi:NADPH:quinone reductase-like Zn-dependent oxidoreductase